MPQLNDTDLTLQALMTAWPETVAVFLRHKMLCIGCPITPHHTVIDACREYDLDVALFRAELDRAIRK